MHTRFSAFFRCRPRGKRDFWVQRLPTRSRCDGGGGTGGRRKLFIDMQYGRRYVGQRYAWYTEDGGGRKNAGRKVQYAMKLWDLSILELRYVGKGKRKKVYPMGSWKLGRRHRRDSVLISCRLLNTRKSSKNSLAKKRDWGFPEIIYWQSEKRRERTKMVSQKSGRHFRKEAKFNVGLRSVRSGIEAQWES